MQVNLLTAMLEIMDTQAQIARSFNVLLSSVQFYPRFLIMNAAKV